MKILLCNDDGVHAPGIKILYKVLSKIADVTVVAPLEERSATGHTLTLDSPLRVVEVEEKVYGCSGFPADCALLGIAHIMAQDPPELIVSGINRGANLGQDIFYSGTVAAAREACFRNIPAIAISSVVDFLTRPPKDKDDELYETAAFFVRDLIQKSVHETISPYEILNINVPNLNQDQIASVELTKPGIRHYSQEIMERKDFRGREYYWIGGIYQGFQEIEGSDCLSVENKNISVSSLIFNQSTNLLQNIEFKHQEKWKAFLSQFKDWSSWQDHQFKEGL